MLARPGNFPREFPVVQACGSLQHAWIEIPTDGSDGHDLEEPAPSLVIAGEDSGDGGSSWATPLGIISLVLSTVALSAVVAIAAMKRSADQD